MAEQTRPVNKTKFETDDRPTQTEFVDLIDSMVNRLDDYTELIADPGVNEDSTKGFKKFDLVINTAASPKKIFLCAENTPGAALWIDMTVGPAGPTGPAGPSIISGTNLVSITTQTEFEAKFGKSFGDTTTPWHDASFQGGGAVIPDNTLIILNPISGTIGDSLGSPLDGKGDNGANVYNGRPAYVLKNQVRLSLNVQIIGFNEEDTVIIKDDSDNTNEDNLRFFNDRTEGGPGNIASVTAKVFTMDSSLLAGVFNKGDLVHTDEDNTFYRVTAQSGVTVTVDRTITNSGGYTGVETLSTLVTGVKMEGWAFDGRGGVNGLGGTISVTDQNGGAFNVPYLGKSTLNCKIVNHKINATAPTFSGGGVFGGSKSVNLRIEKIFDCDAGTGNSQGGGVHSVIESIITAFRCKSAQGGAAAGCFRCNITAHDCSATNGGGFFTCNDSIITAFRCTAGLGGGAHTCNGGTIKAYDCIGTVASDIAEACTGCESIWGNSGTIGNSSLGGIRMGETSTATITNNQVNTDGQYVT